MAQGFRIGVVHLSMAQAIARGGFVSFSPGKRTPVEKPATDDLAYKAPFPGMGFTGWMRDAAWEKILAMPIRPILEMLKFVTNPRHWGMAFRRSPFQIAEADFALIANALRKP